MTQYMSRSVIVFVLNIIIYLPFTDTYSNRGFKSKPITVPFIIVTLLGDGTRPYK